MEKLIYTPTGLCCSLLRGNAMVATALLHHALTSHFFDLCDDVCSVNMYVCLNVSWYLNCQTQVQVQVPGQVPVQVQKVEGLRTKGLDLG